MEVENGTDERKDGRSSKDFVDSNLDQRKQGGASGANLSKEKIVQEEDATKKRRDAVDCHVQDSKERSKSFSIKRVVRRVNKYQVCSYIIS